MCDNSSDYKVKQFGEVFTPSDIVDAMNDMADKHFNKENINYDEYISKTYLEPACGDGQILIEILHRKISAIPENLGELETKMLVLKALGTVYGIEIQDDNVRYARRRLENYLMGTVDVSFSTTNKPKEIKCPEHCIIDSADDKMKNAVKFIIEHNIKHGDMLTCEDKETNDTLYFTEYTFDNDNVSTVDSTLDFPGQMVLTLKQVKPVKYYSLFDRVMEAEKSKKDSSSTASSASKNIAAKPMFMAKPKKHK